MKIKKYEDFLNEQMTDNESALLEVTERGLAELDAFENNKDDPEFIAYLNMQLLMIKNDKEYPEVIRKQLINNIILLKDQNYRINMKKSLEYIKNKLESGTKAEELAKDPTYIELNKDVEDNMVRALKTNKENIASNTLKFLKGARKYGDIRREEASRVIASPEDPFGEESWEGALSDEDAIKKAFAQNESLNLFTGRFLFR